MGKAPSPRSLPSASDAALERVRAICLGFPGAEEKLSHGAPSFHVRGKMFVNFVDDHHADGRLAVWCKAMPDDQRRLVASAPDRYFVPPYVGVRGWVGVRLDRPDTDWIDLAIVIEQGWTEIAPPTLKAAGAAHTSSRPRPPPPVRNKTDAQLAAAALERVVAISLALPDAAFDPSARHATFTARKRTFAYFLDNHHGDGVIGVCVKAAPGHAESLVAAEPRRFYRPAYIGSRGWVGVRVDLARVDWRDVARRIAESHALVTAPKPKATRAPRASGR